MPTTASSLTSTFSGLSDRRPEPRVTQDRIREMRIESHAANILAQQPHFRGRTQFVELRCIDNRLILGGCLPSFYLKQLAQESLREMREVEIENRISVMGIPSVVTSQHASRANLKPR